MTPFSKNQKPKLRVVIDTNLFISVFVFRGKMVRTIFELIIEDKLDMYVSPDLKEELNKKLQFFGITKRAHNEVPSYCNRYNFEIK